MKEIIDIIKTIELDLPSINPTIIYNEGWMTRLLVYQSVKEGLIIGQLDFSKIRNWTSEALIGSPFIRAPHSREGYTHADLVLGDFTIDYSDRGEVIVKDDAQIFGIIEAKMGSNLSQGTKYAANYNQASRNIACIAHSTINCNCEIFFAIAAPKGRIQHHLIHSQIKMENVLDQINSRYGMYDEKFKDENKLNEVIERAKTCKSFILSYEEWIDNLEPSGRKVFEDFYSKSLKYNRL